MKILAVSDLVLERLYSPQVGEILHDVNLVLGCGDLPFAYLEFLVSALNVPLLFVPGNHDPRYDLVNPAGHAEGCENIDRRVAQVRGLTIAGLGGSQRYPPGGVNQYTQAGMYQRMASLLPALFWRRLRTRRCPDIIIAHSPPLGIHDDDDLPHRGFSAFITLLRWVRPRYFLHGHKMVYKNNLEPISTKFGDTTILNIYPYRLFEMDAHVR